MNVKIIVKLTKESGGTADREELAEEVRQMIENDLSEVIAYDEEGEEVIWVVDDVELG